MFRNEDASNKELLIFSKSLGVADIGRDFVLIFGERSKAKDVDFGNFTITNSSYNLAFEIENNGKNKRQYNKLIRDKERIKFIIRKDDDQYEFNGYLTDLIEEDDRIVLLTKINKVITI